jgi:hypothetical protein
MCLKLVGPRDDGCAANERIQLVRIGRGDTVLDGFR